MSDLETKGGKRRGGALGWGARGRCLKHRWTMCGCAFGVTCGPCGVPSVLRQGMPRGPVTTPEASLDYRPAPGCEQEGPPHASFLRISIICASLWFGLTVAKKAGGKKGNGFRHLSKTDRRGESRRPMC